jgi:hypothetical protein
MYVKGDKIILVRMNDDPDPIPPGTKGVIENVHTVNESGKVTTIITVDWEIRRSLNVILPIDEIKKAS